MDKKMSIVFLEHSDLHRELDLAMSLVKGNGMLYGGALPRTGVLLEVLKFFNEHYPHTRREGG
jgi:hypothetical protein